MIYIRLGAVLSMQHGSAVRGKASRSEYLKSVPDIGLRRIGPSSSKGGIWRGGLGESGLANGLWGLGVSTPPSAVGDISARAPRKPACMVVARLSLNFESGCAFPMGSR